MYPRREKRSRDFQSKVEPLFADIRDRLKDWLDDFPAHRKTEAELLDALEMFLEICVSSRLKITARQTHLFQQSVNWRGRDIDKDGVRLDPRNLNGLQEIHLPLIASDLCEYASSGHTIASSGHTMSNGIPDFAHRIAPFKEVLEEDYNKSGSRTKKGIKRIPLSAHSWSEKNVELFHELQYQLRQMVKLSHHDPTKALCNFIELRTRSGLEWSRNARLNIWTKKSVNKFTSHYHSLEH